MNDGRTEARHDQRIAEMATRDYHDPPTTPAGEIWAGIEARLADEPMLERQRRRVRLVGWTGLAAAASVALLLGIGIGRVTAPGIAPPADRQGAAESPATALPEGVRTVTAAHLEQTESLLSFVQADARAGRFDGAIGGWGRELLTETRLLLDSEVGEDPALREILLDLEVLLAQVALLGGAETPERGREELRLIADGLDRQQMMSRIRTALPSMETGFAGS